MPLKARNDYMF